LRLAIRSFFEKKFRIPMAKIPLSSAAEQTLLKRIAVAASRKTSPSQVNACRK
jgi:hypothetical protein